MKVVSDRKTFIFKNNMEYKKFEWIIRRNLHTLVADDGSAETRESFSPF